MVAERKYQRYLPSQTARVKLPRPKLARVRGICQQKAKATAEASAPPSNILAVLIGFLPLLFKRIANQKPLPDLLQSIYPHAVGFVRTSTFYLVNFAESSRVLL